MILRSEFAHLHIIAWPLDFGGPCIIPAWHSRQAIFCDLLVIWDIKLCEAGRLIVRRRCVVGIVGWLVALVGRRVEHGCCVGAVATTTAAATAAAAEAAVDG